MRNDQLQNTNSSLSSRKSDEKQIFSLGNRQYELVIVNGTIRRGNRTFAAQFDHDAGLLEISSAVPVDQRGWVVAVAVSDACFRLWRPIPVLFPSWLPDEQSAFAPHRPGPADGPREQ